MNFKYPIAAFQFLLLLLLFSGCNNSENPEQEISTNPFPTKLYERVVLDEEQFGGANRLVNYADDGFTPVSEKMTMPDGSLRHIYYRADFSIWRFLEYYPPEEEGAEPKLEREVLMTQDGNRYFAHTSYSPDGSRIEQGGLTMDGGYSIKYFFEDSKTISRVALYGKDNQKQLSDNFYDREGNLLTAKEYVYGTNSAVKVTTFNEQSLPILRETKFKNKTDREVEYFYAGTETVSHKIKYANNVEVTRFDEDGNKTGKWSIAKKKLQYFRYAKDKLVFRQDWNWIDDQGGFALHEVREEDYVEPREGKQDWKIRVVVFKDGNSVPFSVQLMSVGTFSKTVDTQDFLNADGEVVRRESGSGGTSDETDYENPVPLFKPLDSSRFHYVPFELPEGVELEVNPKILSN